MTKTISGEVAVELLHKARNEKGADYQYKPIDGPGVSGCVYTTPSNEPSCIVGHALAYAGVPLNVLHAIDYGGATVTDKDTGTDYTYDTSITDTPIYNQEVLEWLERNGYTLSQGALEIFGRAQNAQDDGMTWGGAVSYAESNNLPVDIDDV